MSDFPEALARHEVDVGKEARGVVGAGWAHARAKRWAAAENCFKSALELTGWGDGASNERGTAMDAMEAANIWGQLAKCYTATGRVEDAEAAWAKAVGFYQPGIEKGRKMHRQRLAVDGGINGGGAGGLGPPTNRGRYDAPCDQLLRNAPGNGVGDFSSEPRSAQHRHQRQVQQQRQRQRVQQQLVRQGAGGRGGGPGGSGSGIGGVSPYGGLPPSHVADPSDDRQRRARAEQRVAAKAATKAKERQGRKDPFPKATAAAAAGPFVPYSNGMGRGGTLFGLDAIYVTPHFRMVTVPVCIRHSHPITALDMTPRTAAVCRANDVDPDWLRIRDFHSFHADSGEVDVQERGRRFQHWNERRDYMFKVRGVKRGSERREAEPTAVCGVRRENRGEGPNLLPCFACACVQ